jgi:hypothetical protein
MRPSRYPWVLWGLSLLLVLVAAWALVATGGLDPGAEPSSPTQRWGELLMAAISATAGAVILSNRGTHPVGFIFMAFGLLGSAQQLGISYAATCVDDPGSCALGVLGILDALWFLTVTLGLGGLFLLFPDGEIPKGRRWLGVSLVAAGIGSLALAPFTPELYHIEGVANPWAIDAPRVLATIDEAKGVVVLLLAVIAIVDFVWRARNAEGLVRLQNRWLALAGLLTVLGGALSVVGQEAGVDLGWAWSIGVASMPVAVTMAITRHRLYEIDRIISRTVSYAIVITLLALVYVVGLAGLTTLLDTDSPLAVAGSTLAVAALFNPLRRRVQAIVDHRFNRSRYDAERVMDGFAASLRDEVDPDRVVGGWVSVVNQTMHPASAGVWVKGDL